MSRSTRSRSFFLLFVVLDEGEGENEDADAFFEDLRDTCADENPDADFVVC